MKYRFKSKCSIKYHLVVEKILINKKKQVPEKFLDHQTSYNPSKKMRLDAYINTCNHQSIFINCALKVTTLNIENSC